MKKIFFSVSLAAIILSCSKEKTGKIEVAPSNGSTMQLNGLIGSEPGSAAGNTVFVDLSTDKQTAVACSSWDLGFYCGSDFRVIIKNTTAAIANATAKTYITTVGIADTVGKIFAFSQFAPQPSHLSLIDDIDGDLTKTVIPAISASAAENKVIVINRGTGGSTLARDFIKVKIVRNGLNGYTLQYAKLTETTFKTINIEKDSKYHFKYISFDKGALNVEPEKASWDFVWSNSIFKTSMGGPVVPYFFSDLVDINYLSGTKVAEKNYTTIEEAATAYTAYNKSNLSNESFSQDMWKIGSGWRMTPSPGSTKTPGTIKTKFYIIKDGSGNAYKLKFTSFISDDGGTRGKPEIKYELIK